MNVYRRRPKPGKVPNLTYYVKFEYRGVVIRKTTDQTNKIKAEAVARKIYEQHTLRAHGVLLDEDTDVKAVTLDALRAEYLEFAKLDHPASAEETDPRVTQRFIEIVGSGDTFIHTITRKMIDNWRIKRCQDKTRRGTLVTASCANRELNVIRAMFRQAVEWKYLKESPCANIGDFDADEKPIEVLSAAECERAFALPAPWGIFCEVTYRTLTRLGEVTSLKNEHVTITRRADGHEIATMQKKVKGGKWKRVQIPLELAKRMRAFVTSDDQEFLFPDQVESDAASAQLVVRLRRLGIKASHHAFRHTGITRMLEAGVNPRAIQEHAGWSSLKQLARYGHVLDREFARAVEATGDYLIAARAEQKQAGGAA